jgi:hypothetical protein
MVQFKQTETTGENTEQPTGNGNNGIYGSTTAYMAIQSEIVDGSKRNKGETK